MEHISVISNLYPPFIKGGYEILAEEFANYARKTSVVSVLTSALEGDEASDPSVTRTLQPSVPWNDPPTYERTTKVKASTGNYLAALRFFKKERPTKAFFWNLNRIGLGPVMAAQQLGIPCYFTINDYYPLQYTSQNRWRDVWKRTLWQAWPGMKEMHFTFISKYLKDDLATQGFAPTNAHIVYQGTDIDQFPMKPNPWSLGSPLRLLYTGTLSEDKGVDTLLKSLVGLDRPYHLTLVGGGMTDYVDGLKHFVKEHKLSDNVTFTGQVPRASIKDYLHANDALVFPSQWPEPFGLSHLEAMASGLFVLTTAVGGVQELLTPRVFAETFEAGNAVQLQGCIRNLYKYGQSEQKRAEASTAWVRSHYSLPRYCEELLSFLSAA